MADPLVIKISEPQEVDIVAYRGDTGGFIIAVAEPDESPIDISEATWDCDIRVKKNDTESIAVFDVEPIFGESDKVKVTISVENSRKLIKKCYYDIEMTLNGEVFTLIQGKILAGEDVSRP